MLFNYNCRDTALPLHPVSFSTANVHLEQSHLTRQVVQYSLPSIHFSEQLLILIMPTINYLSHIHTHYYIPIIKYNHFYEVYNKCIHLNHLTLSNTDTYKIQYFLSACSALGKLYLQFQIQQQYKTAVKLLFLGTSISPTIHNSSIISTKW